MPSYSKYYLIRASGGQIHGQLSGCIVVADNMEAALSSKESWAEYFARYDTPKG